MLEVKGLVKQYKPKRGEVVKALDGVNLSFPQKGMIFILGKSGSGKSTLLNLLGGLDTYDKGEIIIKGKSSKDFTQSEFDSYRNTYLGFIFQSYNVLDDFSVASNISLALELQNEKSTPKIIEDILEQVDLKGFGGRKPRELSGGQKQRVAIARALVKNPEIILADEPTGALDSTTGIAVFDTLKKLSKDKLVIIVSHDREFAENYGDRVIEFKDGNIISDIVKYEVENKEISKGISLYENQAIKITKGYELTQLDFEAIKKHIKESGQDVILSLNERTTTAAKVAARITDDGASESFRATKEEDIVRNNNDVFRLKKSKLGFKNSFKIGASSLKAKPGRLIMTMILAVASFAMFGLADTMGSYNAETTTYQALIDEKVTYSSLEKTFYTSTSSTRHDFSSKDILKLDLIHDVEALPVLNGWYNISVVNQVSASFYNAPNKKSTITKSFIEETGLELIGELPANNSQVAVTTYHLEYLMDTGVIVYESSDSPYVNTTIKSSSDLIGKTIYLDNEKVLVTGIIDTKVDFSKYDELKDASFNDRDSVIYTEFYTMLEKDIHNTVFYHSSVFDEIGGTLNAGAEIVKYNDSSTVFSFYGVNFEKVSSQNILYFDNDKTSLSKGDVVISGTRLSDIMWDDIMGLIMNTHNPESTEYKLIESYVNDFVSTNGLPDGILSNDHLIQELCSTENFSNKENPTLITRYGTLTGQTICEELLDYSKYEGSASMNIYYGGEFNESTINVVGYSYDIEYDNNIVLISDDSFDDYSKFLYEEGFSQLFVALPNDPKKLEEFVKYTFSTDDDGYRFVLTCSQQVTIAEVSSYLEMFTSIFLYLGIGFAVFSSLLLYNFVSISISYKQKEIGILRAIGARSRDVFGIFFCETSIIGFFNFLLSVVVVFVASNFLNQYIQDELGYNMSILIPSIRQIILILGVSFAVSLVSSFLPVNKIAKKRPIESIRQG